MSGSAEKIQECVALTPVSSSEGGSTPVAPITTTAQDVQVAPPKKNARFWIIILSLMLASFILALDIVSNIMEEMFSSLRHDLYDRLG